MNIDQIKEQIIKKTWQDEKFKKAFIADPKKTLQAEFKIAVANNVKVTVLEETDEQIYFILPGKPKLDASRRGFWFKPKKELPKEHPF